VLKQVPLADAIKKSLPEESKIPVSTVGLITDAHQAEEILQEGKADVVEFPLHSESSKLDCGSRNS
jgi:2,4-dienoyl-CoA reductase-like NADH-dependent reductase (Old Yellow Enzyme family)